MDFYFGCLRGGADKCVDLNICDILTSLPGVHSQRRPLWIEREKGVVVGVAREKLCTSCCRKEGRLKTDCSGGGCTHLIYLAPPHPASLHSVLAGGGGAWLGLD